MTYAPRPCQPNAIKPRPPAPPPKRNLNNEIEYYKSLLIKAAKLINTDLPLPDDQQAMNKRYNLLDEIRNIDPHTYRFEIG